MRLSIFLCAATAMPVLAAPTGAALAQDAQPAPRALEEIVVTAERTESTAQSTPIAISAFSGAELDELQLTDISRLSEYVPGLHVASHGFAGGSAILAIRGVGSTTLVGDPTVAFHVDGQYFSVGRSLNSTFYDLERVEILKGPQGTLYGRNSTAGVVNAITAKPEDEFKANITGTYGNYNTVGAQGMVNVPIVDSRLAGRFAFNYNKHDGYQEATRPGQQDVYDGNDLSLRGSIRFTPTEDITIGFVADYYKDDINGAGYQALNNPFIPVGQFDPFKNYFNTQTFKKQESTSYRLTASWDTGPVVISSLSAYIRDKLDSRGDGDGNGVQIGTQERHFPLEAFQQELRFSGELGDRVEWQLGAFYYKEKNIESFFVQQDLVPTAGMPPVPPFIFITPAGRLDPIFNLTLDPNTKETESIALYTHDKVRLTDTITLTLGARYNRDKRGQVRVQPTITDRNLSKFDSFTWKVGLDWKPNDNHLVYGSVGTGFKSGGVNEVTGAPDFRPEEILAVEVGWKARLLNDRAQFNASAYGYDYTDLQVSVISNNRSLTANAEGAEIWGAELEGRVLLTDRLTLDASASYVHSKVGSLSLACPMTALPACPGIPGFFPPGTSSLDVTGNPLSQSPEFSATIGVEYRTPVWNGELTGRMNYSYQSEVLTQIYADIPPFTLLQQDGIGMVDASVRYEADSNRWFAEAFVNNLTDEEKLVAGMVVPPSAIYGSFAPPRTFGVRLGYRWE